MSTRGRGIGGRERGRGRRGRVQADARFMSASDDIPHIGHSTAEAIGRNNISEDCEEHSLAQDNEREHDIRSSEGQNSHGRIQGETQGSQVPSVRDSRPLIQPYHDGFVQGLMPRRIMEILNKYMGPWPTWEQVPRDRKDFLFEKFKEKFTWLPEHDVAIRHSWEQTHKRNYKNNIYRLKKKAIEKVGSDDPMDIQKVVPKNMSSNDWEAICNGHMSAPAYRDKCKKAKENRMSEKDGSITKHTGGSISFAKHARRMSQGGGMVSQIELHDRTHRKAKGQGEYIDNKSRRVREEYDKEYAIQHGNNPTPESSFDAQKWIQISGGPSKGRVYSFGNTYRSHDLVSDGPSFESVSMAPPPTYVSQEQMTDAIAKAIEEQKKATALAVSRAEQMTVDADKMMKGAKNILSTFGVMMAKMSSNQADASSSHREDEDVGDK